MFDVVCAQGTAVRPLFKREGTAVCVFWIFLVASLLSLAVPLYTCCPIDNVSGGWSVDHSSQRRPWYAPFPMCHVCLSRNDCTSTLSLSCLKLLF